MVALRSVRKGRETGTSVELTSEPLASDTTTVIDDSPEMDSSHCFHFYRVPRPEDVGQTGRHYAA